MINNIPEKEEPFEFTSKDTAFAASLTRERISEISQQLVNHKAGASIEELRAMAIYWGNRWAEEREAMVEAKEAVAMLMVSAKVQEDALGKISGALKMKGSVSMQIIPGMFTPEKPEEG